MEQNTKCGGFRGRPLTDADRRAGKIAKNLKHGYDEAATLAALNELRMSGGLSLRRLAAELTARGIATPGGGTWHANSVRRLLNAAMASAEA